MTTSERLKAKILLVEDEADLRDLFDLTLVKMGIDADLAGSVGRACELLQSNVYQLVVTDMRLPDGEGLAVVHQASQRDIPVVVMTAFGSAENAVQALKAGAFDYRVKPVALEDFRTLVRAVLSSAATPQGEDPSTILDEMTGVSEAAKEVRRSILRVAKTMAPVAITGESGSGKELAARLIHRSGPRSSAPFIAVNCGAIPETLMEAEFFGYRKGAFTGADRDREGFFQAADGGTLFLDEIAELPLAMQVKLLRAIQEKRVRPVGAQSELAVDVRVVSATHQNLAECVNQGRFRQDLYYRLNVIELRVPPLRERVEDIPLLAARILERLAERNGLVSPPALAPMTQRFLMQYAFPGNVRELENLLERALAFCGENREIRLEDLGLKPQSSMLDQDIQTQALGDQEAPAIEALDRLSDDGVPSHLPSYLDHLEAQAILAALRRTGNNRTAAARVLGVTFRGLRHRMQRLGLS